MESLLPIVFKSQRILTTEQLAEVYETEVNNIQANYKRNERYFEEGKHYFLLKGDELKEFKNRPTNSQLVDKHTSQLYLWTEKGANRHCKILDTDKAWEQFGNLEETYFIVKEQLKLPSSYSQALRELAATVEEKERLEEQNKLMAPKAEFYDDVAGSKDAIAIGDAAKLLNMGIGPYKLFQFLREKKVIMQNNIPYQEFIDRGYFRTIEQKYTTSKGETKINIKTLVYQKGLDYIRKLLKVS